MNGLEICDRTLKFYWRTRTAYDGLIEKHNKFLANHEMLQIRNLEHEELDSVDDALRAIKEVKKIYKTTHFDRMEICDLVVEKKFKNSYIEKIDDILHGMVQNVNRKFNYPPN